MPVERGRDRIGPYYRWGKHGTKYHYTPSDPRSREDARARASRQGQAAHAHGYR
jgi:hypothetical protein